MPWVTSPALISTLPCRWACGGEAIPERELPHYLIAQVVGGILGAVVLYVIASGATGFEDQSASPRTGSASTLRAATPCSPAWFARRS